MKPISARQLELLRAIRAFAEDSGRMPSVREMAEQLGKAPSTVQQHIDALCKKGQLERDGSAHGIRLTERRPASLAGGSRGAEAAPGTVEVRLLGVIAAGAPIEAVELPDEALTLPSSLAPPGCYALEVSGDSMIGDHIVDGDVVLVQPRATVDNGTIAVVLLPEGEVTLKRVYKEGDKVRLQPSNPRMAPTFVDSAVVQGKVVGILRKL